jgi:hypothetical protein
MDNTEQIGVRNLQFIDGVNGANVTIKVTLTNTGSSSVTITDGSIHGANRALVEMSLAWATMDRGSFVVVTLTLEPDTLVYGTEYNVQLTSAKGNTITYSSTFD